MKQLISKQEIAGAKNPLVHEQEIEVPVGSKFNLYGKLHVAAVDPRKQQARDILKGASYEEANKADHAGNLPLHWAAYHGRGDYVAHLIAAGSVVNQQNFSGETALMIAVSRGFTEVGHLLLLHGANPNICNIDFVTPAHMACAMGNDAMLRHLAMFGAFLNVGDEVGDSPLHYAVRESRSSTVELLVNGCRVDCTIRNEDGETAEELASCLGEISMMGFLAAASRRFKQ